MFQPLLRWDGCFYCQYLNKYLPSLCFLSLLVTRILLSFIPTMVPCHCSLHRSSHQHTMMAASISAWDVPITHGRVRSHELSPSSSFLFPTHTLCSFLRCRQTSSPNIGAAVHVSAMLRANSRDGNERQGLAVGPV